MENKTLNDLYSKAVTHHKNEEFGQAIDLYKKILDCNPDNTTVLTACGEIMYTTGINSLDAKTEKTLLIKAQDFFLKSASVERANKIRKAEKLLTLSSFYLSLNKIDYAIKYGKMAHRLNPSSTVICFIIGDSYFQNEIFSEAKIWYEKALELDSTNLKAFHGIGKIYMANFEYKKAFEHFSKFLRKKEFRNKVNIDHYIKTAIAAKSAGFLEEALRLCNVICKANPKTPKDIRSVSLAYIILSNYEKAFEILTANGPTFSGIPFDRHKELSSKDLMNSNLKKIGDMQAQINLNQFKINKSPIFFVAGNEKYLYRYFDNLADSVWRSNSEQRVHLHLMIESLDIIPELKNKISDRFSFSYEMYNPPDKTGFTIRRFYRMYQLAILLKCPILLGDMDLICSKNLQVLLDQLKGSDIGILIREHESVINQQVLASLFYCNPTPEGLKFLRMASNYMFELEFKTKPTWFVDQMALFAAYNYYEKVEKTVNISKIPHNAIILDNQKAKEDTIFLHAKGKGKGLIVKELNLPESYFEE